MEKLVQSFPPLPPPQKGVEIYVWIKVLTAMVVFKTAVLSFYITRKKCRSNNNDADPGLELQGRSMGITMSETDVNTSKCIEPAKRPGGLLLVVTKIM